jgi:glucose/arabinose dehydrogenase
LFQTSDTTWQAYNPYGGNSLYVGAPAGRAYKVSYNRPFTTRADTIGGAQSWLFTVDYPMVRWLEANGYDVSYSTGVDSDRRGAELLEHKVFLSVGHDEYWSGNQRANVEAARNAGIDLAFFSGNEIFWKTRWENSIAGTSTAYRTLVSYKETHANAKIDPTAAWTGTWRDPRFSPPADGGRPENALTGQLFMVNGSRNDPMSVPSAQGKHRFWRNTSIASLAAGQTYTFAAGVLGYEWNETPDTPEMPAPAGLQRLSTTTLNVTPLYLQDYGTNYGSGTATHSMTLYKASSGALVFGAGTVNYSWGLDSNHDRPGPAADVRLQQATVNLFADMGVQPSTLQAGLVGAAPSNDHDNPQSTITSPAQGASVQSGTPVTISGTASDTSGIVTGVDVSTDGGATWKRATGTTSWTFSWTPSGPGSANTSATLKSRAYDDSGNVETPGAGRTVTITPIGQIVAAYGFNEGSGTVAADVSGGGNTGTISGAAWSSGKFGQGLSFDGTNDWVTVNDAAALDLTNAMTLEAWVNPSALSNWRSVILKEAPPNLLSYGLYANDGVPRPALTVRVASGDVSATGTGALPLNSWTHLAGSYDGATVRLYVNGNEVSTFVANANILASNGPLRIGGNSIWGEYFSGLIDEVRVYRRVLAVSEIQADMNTPIGGGPLPDTTAPTVSITAPANGAVVSGTTSVTATASDNVGVVGVQFLLDGANLGGEDTTAPYSVSWATTGVSDGSHTLSARARDAAGNTGLATNVTVTVSNTPDTTPPTVSITSPSGGATVSNTINVTANAADNVAVVGVVLLVDGTQVGTEDTVSPYSLPWNTTTSSNGSHTVTVRARDAAGNNTTSSPVTVTVSNTPVSPAGLVAAFGFDEGTGTTTTDASGTGNTGTLSNTAWTATGRYGKALTFNGSSSWVTVNDASSLDLTTGMTVEAWVNPTTLTGWRSVVLKEAPGLALSYGLYANDNAPHPAATINLGSDRSVGGTAAVPLNVWTHLAMTYDGTSLRLFVNAVQAGVVNAPGSMITTNAALRIGGNAVWGEYFAGTIDEVRVYNRALSTTELQTDMNTAVGSGDVNPPAVTSVTPPNGSTAGSLVNVVAAFNEPMLASTITSARFNLKNSSGTTIPALLVYDSGTQSAILDPTNPLPVGGVFTATLLGGAGGVTDVAGNPLPSTVTWSFTVSTDTTPPTLVSRSPLPSTVNVASTAPVTATFDEPIDQATLIFVLRDQAGTVIPTTKTYDAPSRTARLQPNSPLAASTAYTASLERVTDVYGNAMAQVSWSFTTGSAGFVETTVFSGLIEPTTMQFASDGRVFVAEKRGVIKVFDSLSDTTPDIFADLRTKVHNYWDRGMLGLALHPSFPTQPYVYVFYSHDAAIGGTAPRWGTANTDSDPCPTPPGPNGDGCVISSRLSRLQAAGNVMTGTEQVLIEDWGQQYPSHSVGSLRFGPDGALYVSGGDGASFTFVDYGQDGNPLNPIGDPPGGVGAVLTPPTAEGGALRSQDLRTTADPVTLDGTILRLDPNTGAAMAGNPLASNPDANAKRVIAYGLRNPFRFAFRPGTNEIWIGDVGWDTWEELNRIPSTTDAVVENFGWPCYEGVARQPGYEATGLSLCTNLYAQPSAVTAPYYQYRHGVAVANETCPTGSSSPSGIAFYGTTGNYPTQYRDALFFADYSRACIWVMFKGTNGLPDPSTVAVFRQGAIGPVDLQIGPAGDLFYADLGGFIKRVQYFDGNAPPVAAITANPTSGSPPLTVNFSGTGSSDPNPGDTLSYAWDLDNDGQFDDGTQSTASFTYTTQGVFNPRLRVTDTGGLTDIKSVTITTNGAAPTATIGTPTPSFTWSVGDVVAFSGSATDPEDGNLPASRLSWQLRMHHCSDTGDCHVHPIQTYPGVASGTFVAPDHEYPSYLELILTATDSSGLTDQKTVRVDPKTAVLSFDTTPSGLSLSVGSGSFVTPFTRTVIIGSNNSISAPSPAVLGATSYEFVSWSDGGAASHNIVTPAGGATYRATYAVVPSMTINSVSVNEAPGGTTANFTVSLSSSSSFTVTASYATSNGTATAGSDYVAKTGTVTFNPGATTATISVNVNDDTLGESNETFLVTLSNPVHAGITGGPGTGTIVDNDGGGAAGLVASYGFTENAGTTTADATGKGHTGTIAGATWVDDGHTGTGLWFDGINDWVTVADANDLDLTTGMTLEAWVRPLGALTGWSAVLLKEATGGLAYGLYANDGNPYPALTVHIGTADQSAIGTSQLPLDAWTHLAATYDGTTMRLFVNGVQVGTKAQTGSMLTSTGALRMGGNAVWTEFFRGVMDDVRIYNRALSAAEIQTDMNTPVQ